MDLYNFYMNSFGSQVLQEEKRPIKENSDLDFEAELDKNDLFKLSYKASECDSCIVDCLKLRRDEDAKPYIITDRNLMIGDIICKESPLFAILCGRNNPSELIEVDVIHNRCYHCFKQNNLESFSCSGCDSVVFCSSMCQNVANKLYHNYECFINAINPDVKDIVCLLRPFFCALFYCHHNIDELKSFILSRNNVNKTIFDYAPSPMNWLHIFDSIDAPFVTDLSSHLPLIFDAHPALASMWTNHKEFLLPYLNRHADILYFIGRDLYKWPVNVETIMKQDPLQKPLDVIRVQKIVGSVFSLFSPLLSLSCKPNIYCHMFKNNETCYIVIRNINEGEKLTISDKDALYFARLPEDEQLNQLKQEFNFLCTNNCCIAEPAGIASIIEPLKDEQLSALPDQIGKSVFYGDKDIALFCYFEMMINLKRNYQKMSAQEFLLKQKQALLQLEFAISPS